MISVPNETYLEQIPTPKDYSLMLNEMMDFPTQSQLRRLMAVR